MSMIVIAIGASVAVRQGAAYAIASPVGVGAASPMATSGDAALAAAAKAADAMIAKNPEAVRRGAGDTMVRTKVHSGGNGLQYVAYERAYRGLPVVGGDAVVVTDATGRVLSTSVAQDVVIDIATAPRVSAGAARNASKAQLIVVSAVSTPRLVVLAWGTPRLVWETVVEGMRATAPSRLHVFVDASTGVVVESYDEARAGSGTGHYNGAVAISTSGSGSFWSMQDPLRSGLRCGGQNGATLTGSDDIWGNGVGTDLETACVDVLYAAQKQWDMMNDWLGRWGFNGSGGGFPARVGWTAINAQWNGTFTNFGRSSDAQRQATAIDIVAHEYGHAVFQTTPGGTGAGNENGGLNEATGDIFGALTEAYANNPNDPPDFLLGEEVDFFGSGADRNMVNPAALGHPGCWSGAIASTEVHAAAGPLNHWFYLVAQGSNPPGGPASPICAGGPPSVTGISIVKAGKIFYNALLAKTSNWNYGQARLAAVNAVRNLYGPFTQECRTVKAAWNAISVPPQAGEPPCDDFALSVSPTTVNVQAGEGAAFTVSTAVTAGSPQSITLSVDPGLDQLYPGFYPSTITAGGSAQLGIGTNPTTPGGLHVVIVRATGESATRTQTIFYWVSSGSCLGARSRAFIPC